MLYNVFETFRGRNRGKNYQFRKEEQKFGKTNTPSHKSVKTIAKLLQIWPVSAFTVLRPQKDARWKEIGDNEKEIAYTLAYFKPKYRYLLRLLKKLENSYKLYVVLDRLVKIRAFPYIYHFLYIFLKFGRVSNILFHPKFVLPYLLYLSIHSNSWVTVSKFIYVYMLTIWSQ